MAYATVAELIGRAAVRCKIASLNPAQIATYDPFAQTDKNIVQMLELLRSLGNDLKAEIPAGL